MNSTPQISYTDFLKSKVAVAENTGFEISKKSIHKICKPHQSDIIRWAIDGGRRAIFASFGLGKTIMNLEIARHIITQTGKPFLIGIDLGTRLEFYEDAAKLGLEITYVKDNDELLFQNAMNNKMLFMSNYERIREGKFNPDILGGFGGDEFSCIRGLDTVTADYLLHNFAKVPYRFIFTATPSPNEYTELLNYAQFLGIMDRGQALTRFFQRDSQKAGNLTLYPHKEKEFWLWVSSWAVFLTKPSDLGYPDEGYDLPELKVHYHEVHVKERGLIVDKYTQNVKMFRDASAGLAEASKEKRESQPARLNKMLEILSKDKKSHFILWHTLESERKEIEKIFPEAKSVYGTQNMEERENLLTDFRNGKLKYLSTKPEIAGQGCNFQYHCHKAIFTGIDYKFNDFIQAIHRIFRFLQTSKVEIHVIYSDAEKQILKVLLEKWQRHNELVTQMTDIIKKYGLSNIKMKADLSRTLGVKRAETKGDLFKCINNDSILECADMKEDSIDLIVTSIPFSDQYEYCQSYHDAGHNNGDDGFFTHLDYLTPNLLRILKPGRIAAIHVKDRIRYSYQNGQGFTSLSDFSGKTVAHFEKHGFFLIGKITITTDVVQENNQTYRLGWTEQCKDATKMGVGLPEYVLLFRKPPTVKTDGYADNPVTKTKQQYTRARWQLDAHAYWKSSGNRLLNPDELKKLNLSQVYAIWKGYEESNIYEFEKHVQICEELEDAKKLPSTFMAVPPHSLSSFVWNDVNRMQTLNASQTNRKKQKHICPLQFDIVDRLINRFSNENEIVLDPFGGIMTTPYRCILLNRYGIGIELNEESYRDGIVYCKESNSKKHITTLFDATSKVNNQ